MDTGTKISAIAHLILIGWVLFGAAFEPEPLPFEVHEVAVISSEDFAAMTTAPTTPDVTDQPAAPAAPDPVADAPDIAALPDTQPEQVQPEAAQEPEAEAVPEQIPQPPAAEPDVSLPAPDMAPPAPEAAPDPAPVQPEPPRPVERVAPQPVAPPPPDARPDQVERTEIAPDEGAETPQEPQEATAPDEATDRIVTEADEGRALAPAASPRPRTRPSRPQPTAATPTPTPAPAPDTRRAVNDALAEALGGSQTPPAPAAVPSGPPLTAGEKDALRVAVSNCWNVGSLSSAAQRTTVVVSVSMLQDGRPNTESIRMVSSSGGSGEDARQAFEAARRAIIRCGGDGYDLPADKYGQWQDIEMTFNPERMRIK